MDDFEDRLQRLFSDSPAMADSETFATRVEKKLNRGWSARRWLIGAAGLIGGVIGASQFLMSSLFERLEGATASARLISNGVVQISPRSELLSALPSGGGMVWIALGLAVVTMGFVLTRVIDEL